MQHVLLTQDVAKTLGISPSAVAARVRSGSLKPFAKLDGIRGAYLFEPAEIQRVQGGDAE